MENKNINGESNMIEKENTLSEKLLMKAAKYLDKEYEQKEFLTKGDVIEAMKKNLDLDIEIKKCLINAMDIGEEKLVKKENIIKDISQILTESDLKEVYELVVTKILEKRRNEKKKIYKL